MPPGVRPARDRNQSGLRQVQFGPIRVTVMVGIVIYYVNPTAILVSRKNEVRTFREVESVLGVRVRIPADRERQRSQPESERGCAG